MKIKKIVAFLSVFLIIGNGLGFVSKASEKQEYSLNNVDAVSSATIIKWYKSDNGVPKDFWIDDHRGKGYVYLVSLKYISSKEKYRAIYKGKLRKGPYVPNKIIEEFDFK